MTKENKPTSAPLPSGRHIDERSSALRANLQKRKQQARARDEKPREKK